MNALTRAIGTAYGQVARRLRQATGPRPGGLPVGGEAPDFELSDSEGRRIRLSSHRGREAVLLIFYPADDTPG